MANGKFQFTEVFRIITPILVTVSLFILSQVITTVRNIDDKLFTHLTNDEIHIPRGLVVTKGEYEAQKFFADERNKLIICAINELKVEIRELRGQLIR